MEWLLLKIKIFIKLLKNTKRYFGNKNLKRFEHDDIGFNFRMTDLQAVIAYSQAIKAKENLLKMKKMELCIKSI